MRKIEDKIVFKSGKKLIFSIFQKEFRDSFFICKNFLYQIILYKINRNGMTMERLLKENFFYINDHCICEYNKNYL